MNNNIKHIWWDMSGTLFHIPEELQQVKNEKRYELYAEVTGQPITEKLKTEYHETQKKAGSNSSVFVSLGKSKDFYAKAIEAIDERPFLKPDPRIIEMFETFKTLPQLHSIMSNTMLETIKKIVTHLKIDMTLFEHIVSNKDIDHPKPHPQGFKKIIEMSQLPPEQILFVGDWLEKEIIPAKQQGMLTAHVWTGEKSQYADFAFSHVADVLTIFKK